MKSMAEIKIEVETKKRHSASIRSKDHGTITPDHDTSEGDIRGMKVPKTMLIDPLLPVDGKPRDGTPILHVKSQREMSLAKERAQKFNKAKQTQMTSSLKLRDMEVT